MKDIGQLKFVSNHKASGHKTLESILQKYSNYDIDVYRSPIGLSLNILKSYINRKDTKYPNTYVTSGNYYSKDTHERVQTYISIYKRNYNINKLLDI